jgi:hypothetical protein
MVRVRVVNFEDFRKYVNEVSARLTIPVTVVHEWLSNEKIPKQFEEVVMRVTADVCADCAGRQPTTWRFCESTGLFEEFRADEVLVEVRPTRAGYRLIAHGEDSARSMDTNLEYKTEAEATAKAKEIRAAGRKV